MDSEEFDWDTEGDSSLGLDRLWALAEVASSLMQAASAVAALLHSGTWGYEGSKSKSLKKQLFDDVST